MVFFNFLVNTNDIICKFSFKYLSKYDKLSSSFVIFVDEYHMQYAVSVLQENHPTETITGDITKVDTKNIPDFDILCAGSHVKHSALQEKDKVLPTRVELCFLRWSEY